MGEAGLPKRSVVNISQIATVDRSMLDGRIGSLGRARFNEVLQACRETVRGSLRATGPVESSPRGWGTA